MAAIRIFHLAKELNISHTDILSFLKTKNIKVSSHMSPVDDEIKQLIMAEFSKDKMMVDRFRKEQVRREIHDTRLKERQDSTKKLQLLSLNDQRDLEKKEQKKKQDKINQEKALSKATAVEVSPSESDAPLEVEKEKIKSSTSKKAEQIKEKLSSPKKQKLRKINLSNIQSEIGQGATRKTKVADAKEQPVHKSVRTKVKATLAAIDTKKKKKVYKKSKTDDVEDIELEDGVLPKISIAEYSSVDEISKIFEITSSEVVQACIELGILVTINQRLDWDLIELLSNNFGYDAEKIEDSTEDLFSLEESDEDKEKATSRAPVVTVMGHVDHGKTSLLDYIRNTNVVGGESGGITQHIGAYTVNVRDEHPITFLDTPGHEAFTAMRARGAQITDLVILIVSADDSVMPQTVEAISHAKAASVPIIVAINKMDKPGADPEKVKRELSDSGVLVESWGGKVQSVEISALKGDGVDSLLDSLIIETEILGLKANKECKARATIIESKLDKGLGPIGTVLVQRGTLKVGDPFICNDYIGKVRAILNERGTRIKEAGPSDAVEIQGFSNVPQAGDMFAVVDNERDLKKMSSDRQRIRREVEQKRISMSLGNMSTLIKDGNMKSLPIIIKGDVDGSVDAVSETLIKLNNDEVEIKIVHKAVGMVTESDVLLAEASKAIIIVFNVQISSNAKFKAKQAGVDIKSYNIIYNVVDDITLALEGLLEPDKVEEILGKAVVQEQFKVPKIGFIAGSRVTKGFIKRGSLGRLLRDGEVINEGSIESLKRFKDDVKEVKDGLECGIGLSGVKKYQEGDIIEIFEIKEISRKLTNN